MKSFLILSLILSLVACTKSNDRSQSPSGNPAPVKTQGGVDVGNLTTAMVPRTNASLSYPNSWKAEDTEQSLILQNGSGSKIKARKSEISEIASPTAISLQQYLQSKHPNRHYEILKLNGLEGVRANVVESSGQKKSDIYLVSELKDFIHIESDLKSAEGGIQAGEAILLTVKVEYRGEPIVNSKVQTVTLPAYYDYVKTNFNGAYSLKNDCYTYKDRDCSGVSVLFANGNNNQLTVGLAGYDHGRIIELGSESEVPFDSIHIDGKYLVAPQGKVSIADIYTAFTPKDPKVEQSRIELAEGKVYLIRTISWPNEDMITKMKVVKLDSQKSVMITYQKLISVSAEELKKQVEAINKYTIENEQPLSEGEVTLYNRSVWDSYNYASFNFQFSTSGNMFITKNNWDLIFHGKGITPVLSVPYSGGSIGEVIDIGERDLKSIQLSDFPDPNSFKGGWGPEVRLGHTYLIYHFAYDDSEFGATYAAVKVLELGPEQKWVRLRFQRIHFGKVPHFQKWIPMSIPQGVQSVTLVGDSASNTSVFHPFIGKRADQGLHYYERVFFTRAGQWDDKDKLSCDLRPYGKDKGFFKLSNADQFNTLTADEAEKYKGRLVRDMNLQEGDVYLMDLENMFDRVVMVVRVDELKSGQSVVLSYRYLSRSKTIYSDDKD